MEELKNVVTENKEVKVNKVSANKAKANSTIKLSVDSIFKSLNEKTNGLLKTSLGKKTEIYVESLFTELNEKQKKAYRKKLRNTTFSLLDSICKAKEEKKQNEKKGHKSVACESSSGFERAAGRDCADRDSV